MDNFPYIANRKLQLITLMLDWVGLLVAFNVMYYFRLGFFREDFLLRYDLPVIGFVMTIVFYIFFLYTPNTRILGLRRHIRAWIATAVLGVIVAVGLYLLAGKAAEQYGRSVLVGSLFIFAVWSSMNRLLLDQWMRNMGHRARWLVIGDEKFLQQLWEEYQTSGFDAGLHFLTPSGNKHGELPIGGSYEKIDEYLKRDWSGIVVASEKELPDNTMSALLKARIKGVRVFDLIDFYSEIWQKVPVIYLSNSWLAMTEGFRLLHNPIGLRIKRVMDKLLSILLLPLALPLIGIAALMILIESGFPVFFKQTRTGINGMDFTLYKLRTMVQDAEKNGAQWAQQNDSRITFLGRFLRKTRIDELPQLFNVLKGDMSFIGPRPERPEFNQDLEKQIPHYNLRHVVRPGITGWAQTLYRYGSSVEDSRKKLEFDLYYIKRYTIWMDIIIVVRTVRTMLFGAGR